MVGYSENLLEKNVIAPSNEEQLLRLASREHELEKPEIVRK